MSAVNTGLNISDLPDSLKALRLSIEEKIPVGFGSHSSSYNLGSPEHQKDVANTDKISLRAYQELAKVAGEDRAASKIRPQLGTLGGGNHFIEICTDLEDNVWVMLHSGSRGAGNIVGSYYINKAKEFCESSFINLENSDLAYIPKALPLFNDYWNALTAMQDYAKSNRKWMLIETLDALGSAVGKSLTLSSIKEKAIQCHHNYATIENHGGVNVYVTRKGAIRAREGDMGIIPGSMGTKSYIVKGKGNKESLCSCSHGAGRVMSRSEARRKLTLDDLIQETEGVECRKDEGVIDESPSSYKNLDSVMDSQADNVEIVHTLKALLCVKG